MNSQKAVGHLNRHNSNKNLIKELCKVVFGTGAVVIAFMIFIAIILNSEAFDRAANNVQKALINHPSVPILLFVLVGYVLFVLIRRR